MSWLAFNERVLAQAQDASHPLLERVKFLAITGTNLDEFFMVRGDDLKFRAGIEEVSTARRPISSWRRRGGLAQIDEQTACQGLSLPCSPRKVHFLTAGTRRRSMRGSRSISGPHLPGADAAGLRPDTVPYISTSA